VLALIPPSPFIASAHLLLSKPPSAGGINTPPPQAANVGFSTPALIADFTAANASSLVNCTIGSTAPSTFYFQGNVGRIMPDRYSCAQNGVFVNDPASNKQAFEFKFLESQLVHDPSNPTNGTCSFSNGSSLCNGISISTASGDSFTPVGQDFPYSYFEITFRTVFAGSFPGITDWSFWSWTFANTNVEEIDFNETEAGDTVNDPGGLGIVDWANAGAFHQLTTINTPDVTYKTVGVLVTGNASVQHLCLYLNNALQGCNDYTPSADQGSQRRYIMAEFAGPKCNQQDGNASCWSTGWGEMDQYIQSIRVFSCSNWQSTMCYTQ